MKHVALALLALGVAICAALGARLSPVLYDHTVVDGQAMIFGERADEAFATYCEARAAAELAIADGCPDEAAEAEAEAAEAEAEAEPADAEAAEAEAAEADEPAPVEAPSREDVVAELTAELDALRATDESLSGDVATARTAWLDAKATAIEPSAAAATQGVVGPRERMAGWAADSGPGFAFGLLLVIVGAVLGRRAARAEASDDSTHGPGGPLDVPAALTAASERARSLADEIRHNHQWTPQTWEDVKTAITAIQFEYVEPLTESGPRMQARYGMQAFADVFSPLSGGERRLNRAWSALVDHHAPEALASLDQAAEQFAAARAALDAHTGK